MTCGESVQPLQSETVITAVLTVKSGPDPHMIIKHKDGIKLWLSYAFQMRCFPKCLSGLV
jgi:hypothetical protein